VGSVGLLNPVGPSGRNGYCAGLRVGSFTPEGWDGTENSGVSKLGMGDDETGVDAGKPPGSDEAEIGDGSSGSVGKPGGVGGPAPAAVQAAAMPANQNVTDRVALAARDIGILSRRSVEHGTQFDPVDLPSDSRGSVGISEGFLAL
jgi:hypothetical protein